MKIKQILGAFLVCAAVACPLAAQETDAVMGLISKVASRMAALEDAQVEGEIAISLTVGGRDRSQRADWSTTYAAPNKLRMTGPGLDLTADGDYLYSRSPVPGEYIKVPITGSLLDALDGNLAEGVNLTPDERALLSGDPAAVLSEFARQYQVTVREDEELDGSPCWRADVVVTGLLPDMDVPIKVWIDQASGLVRQWRVDADLVNADLAAGKGPAAAPNSGNPRIGTYGETAKTIEINEVPGQDVFEFTPGPDEKEVNFFSYGMESNPERFDLSGKKAPDFEVELLDGKTFKLSRDGKDKVVLLDFWATWCGPCLQALPHMAELAKEMEGKDVIFLAISTDEPGLEDQVRQVFTAAGAEYACGFDRDEIDEDYLVEGIPCMVLIDREGVVVGRHLGFGPPTDKFLTATIEKLLAGQKVELAEPSH